MADNPFHVDDRPFLRHMVNAETNFDVGIFVMVFEQFFESVGTLQHPAMIDEGTAEISRDVRPFQT